MQLDVTYLITFLVGALSGGAGQYIGSKYTDKRKNKEIIKEKGILLDKLQVLMPDLIAEMKDDIKADGFETVREIVILPNERVTFNGGGKKRFIYFSNQIDDLVGKIDILEHEGLIVDVTQNNTQIFRMTESFIEMLNK